MHGFRCYDDTHVREVALYIANAEAYSAEREMSASACTRSMVGFMVLLTCEVNERRSQYIPLTLVVRVQ